MPKKENLTNQVFGLVRCISPAESIKGKTYWNCECIKCGFKKTIMSCHLKDGRTKTCGCNCKEEFFEKRNINFSMQQKIKKCEICGQEFLTSFYNRKYCFNCSPASKQYSQAQKNTILRRAMKKEAVKRKGGKCQKCGYDKCLRALQFHHLDPSQKQFAVSHEGKSFPWEKYWAQAEKCILLCANCHAQQHDKLFNEQKK